MSTRPIAARAKIPPRTRPMTVKLGSGPKSAAASVIGSETGPAGVRVPRPPLVPRPLEAPIRVVPAPRVGQRHGQTVAPAFDRVHRGDQCLPRHGMAADLSHRINEELRGEPLLHRVDVEGGVLVRIVLLDGGQVLAYGGDVLVLVHFEDGSERLGVVHGTGVLLLRRLLVETEA